MRTPNSLERAAVALSMTAATILGAAACGREDPTCISDAAESSPYPGTPNVSNDQATWPVIVAETTGVPQDVKAIVSFRNLNSQNLNIATSEYSPSKPITAANAGRIVLGIGPGAVQFRFQYIGKAGTRICGATPPTQFSSPPVPRKELTGVAFAPKW